MHFPFRTFVDPAANELDLLVCQRPLRVGGRHALGFVGRADALEELAVRGLTRHDHLVAAAIGEDSVFGVEAELGHALFFVGTVAGEAGIGEDRPDFAIEIDGLGSRFSRRSGESADESKKGERKKGGARGHKVGSFHYLSL